ncbi:MAG: M48 family metalloprotease, partial [Acidimicrobiia bacterium]|nr:M48 family metalloprotease [Acidimicrobiia bacterium]
MNVEFVLPAMVLLGLTLTLGMGRWHLPPRPAIRALAAVAAIAATTVATVVAATAAAFVLGPARRAEIIEWCRIVPLHHEVGPIAGVASLTAVAFMTIRVWLVLRRRRQATRNTAGRRISVLETPAPIAYAAPGTPGCVVVSTGLLSALKPRERQVVFAHERAHLRQGHHRYVLTGSLAVAIVPLLRPLVD